MRVRVALALTILGFVAAAAPNARAANMRKYDLDSLAYMSTEVIEGDVVGAEDVGWSRRLTIKVDRSFVGEVRGGASIPVWCDVRKPLVQAKNGDLVPGRIEAGERVILFLTHAGAAEPSYAVVRSGLYLLAGGKVTGTVQMSNPGPYGACITEGDADVFRKRVAAAVTWAKGFATDFPGKSQDAKWLLETLKGRPDSPPMIVPIDELETNPPKPRDPNAPLFDRDEIAALLCRAIDATGEPEAIRAASERFGGYMPPASIPFGRGLPVKRIGAASRPVSQR